MVTRTRLSIPVLLAVLSLTACGNQSTDDSGDEKFVAAGTSQQQSIIAAGPVGKVEYEAAVERVRSCLRDRGITLTNEGWDPVRQLGMQLYYSSPGMADDELIRLSDQCRKAHLDAIEDSYQLHRKPEMDPKLHRALITCLGQRGISMTNASTDASKFAEAIPGTKTEELASCVNEVSARLYPSMQQVSF
ncbi:hypothetical protein [Actinoplanes sp. NPDC049118]|uniref:hypothetical protein n=1 Tax=Actinoplanes sp. NPDC049118 TaxID=3155769 RepID=UPI00340DF0F4